MRKEKVFWIPYAPTGDLHIFRSAAVLAHYGIAVGIRTKFKGSGKRRWYLLSL